MLSKYQSQLLKKYHLSVKIVNYTSTLFTEKTVLLSTDLSQKATETSFSVLRLKVFLNEAQKIADAKELYAIGARDLVSTAVGAGTVLGDVADTHIAYVKAQIAFAEAAPADKATKKTAKKTAKAILSRISE